MISLVALVATWAPMGETFEGAIATTTSGSPPAHTPALTSSSQAGMTSPFTRVANTAKNASRTVKAFEGAKAPGKILKIYLTENWNRVRRTLGSEKSLMDNVDPNLPRQQLLQIAADTETSGLPDNPNARVLSLGAVKHQHGEVLPNGAKQWLFNPGEDALVDFLRLDIEGRENTLVPIAAEDVKRIAASRSFDELPDSTVNAVRAEFMRLGLEFDVAQVRGFETTREPPAAHVHGITWDLLKKHGSFADQLDEINEFFMNGHPQGYNANAFDRELILRELRRVPVEQRPQELAPVFDEALAWIDTQDRAFSGLVDREDTGGRLKLDRIAPYYGIELEQHPTPTVAALEEGIMAAHSAIGDAEATRRVDDIFFQQIESERGASFTYKEMMRDQWRRRATLRYAIERAHRGY